ncbi:hypothetical protein D3C81_1485860 [compost metagenome]
MKQRVQLLFQFAIIVRLWKAVIRRLAGIHLPRGGDPRLFALNNDFLIFTMMHNGCGELSQRPV